MKRSVITTVLLGSLVFAASFVQASETEEPEGLVINNQIEDGNYIIRIPAEEGDEGWTINGDNFDESILKIESALYDDDGFTAVIAPAADGTATVEIDHYDDFVCDQRFTWDLLVEDGKITESTGGSHEAAPDEESLDPYLSGEWTEEETQLSVMTISKNPEQGWDIKVVSAADHDAYVFTATARYDCVTEGLAYQDGAIYQTSITDSEEEEELGEPYMENIIGSFTFEGETEKDLQLIWKKDVLDEETITFSHN